MAHEDETVLLSERALKHFERLEMELDDLFAVSTDEMIVMLASVRGLERTSIYRHFRVLNDAGLDQERECSIDGRLRDVVARRPNRIDEAIDVEVAGLRERRLHDGLSNGRKPQPSSPEVLSKRAQRLGLTRR